MKVYDTKHVYTWEAVSVEYGSFPIYQPEERYYKKSTREKVWKMQKTFNENWFKAADYHKASVDAAGNVVMGEAVSKFTPYEPLEKE